MCHQKGQGIRTLKIQIRYGPGNVNYRKVNRRILVNKIQRSARNLDEVELGDVGE